MYYVNGSVLSRVLRLGATYAKLLSHTKITIFPQSSLVYLYRRSTYRPQERVG